MSQSGVASQQLESKINLLLKKIDDTLNFFEEIRYGNRL